MSLGERDAVKYGQKHETLRGVKEKRGIEVQAQFQLEEVQPVRYRPTRTNDHRASEVPVRYLLRCEASCQLLNGGVRLRKFCGCSVSVHNNF